ncbi:zinc finger protein 718-like [Ylistrum balloti]|uniref:zinc finger protein 718-like n=1 Tax=Ylistrum balloti TaxID=509963 RepID=UPI00290599DD|nr:zinc finger protein 718-like [Ylistrum balloti]
MGARNRNPVRPGYLTETGGWDNTAQNLLDNKYNWKDYSQPEAAPVQTFGQVSQGNSTSLQTGDNIQPVQLQKEPPGSQLKNMLTSSPHAGNVLVKGSLKGNTLSKFQCSGNVSTISKAPYTGYVRAKTHTVTKSSCAYSRSIFPKTSLGENPTDSDSYKCRICAKVFNSFKAMNRHLRVHDQHRCKQCNQGFKSDLLLQKHNTDHHTFKFPCASCGKLFGRKFTLKRHEMYTCTQKRFAETTNEETSYKRLKIPKADNTLKANRKASVVFRDYLREKGQETDFEQQSVAQLCKHLGHFYMDARKHDGTHYKTSSLEQFRYSLNRYLRSPPFNKQYDIIKDCEFSEANVNFKAVMNELKRMGKGETEHYPVITKADRHTIYSSQHLNVNTPVGLYNKVQFDIRLYFSRRSTENMHKMTKSTFEIVTDFETGLRYVRKADEMFKNLHSHDKDVLSCNYMPESPGSPFCPVASFESYICKLNPQCERLWQRPNRESSADSVWYYNSPVGEKKLAVFMSELSKACKLSCVYTNYSIRATGSAILSKNMFDAAQIMSITGHQSDLPQSIYQRPEGQRKCRTGQSPPDNVELQCIKLESDGDLENILHVHH